MLLNNNFYIIFECIHIDFSFDRISLQLFEYHNPTIGTILQYLFRYIQVDHFRLGADLLFPAQIIDEFVHFVVLRPLVAEQLALPIEFDPT